MLTVIVPVHNPDMEIFGRMLRSMKKYTPELSQVIVFDNASDRPNHIKKFVNDIFNNGVRVDYIRSNENLGYGKACNQMLRHVQNEFMVIANDDIEVFGIWAAPMLDILKEDSKVAQVVPKYGVCNAWNAQGFGCPVETDEPEYAEGSLCMTRTALMKEYGFFNETYEFAYFEDADLSLRLRRDGYKIRNVDIKWKHYRAVTSSKVDADIQGYHVKNEQVFKSQWSAYLLKKRFGKTIAIRRTGTLGDVFLVTPIIEKLKEKYPDSVIILMTSCPDTIKNNHHIDAIVSNVYAPVPCEVFIDLDNAYERNFKVNIVDAYAQVAGVELKDKTGILFVDKKSVDRMNKMIPADFGDFVTLEIGDTWPEKKWPYENYKELAQLIREDNLKVVGIGVKPRYYEDYINLDLDFTNTLDVIMTGCLLHKAKMHIGHEGLIPHMAQAVQIPSIVLYGCTSPEYCNDISSKNLYPVVTEAACRGCRHRVAAGNMVLCPRKAICMKMISVEKVYEKYLEVKNR